MTVIGYNCLTLLPILYVVFTFLTFIITYIIAVTNHDINPYIPSISDTGRTGIERNIFCLGLNLSCIIGSITMIVRYLQCSYDISEYDEKKTRLVLVNKLALAIGVLIAIGGFVTAAFESTAPPRAVHKYSSSMFFFGSLIYIWLHTYLSHRMFLVGKNSRGLVIFRIVTTLLTAVAILVGAIFDFSRGGHGILHYPTRMLYADSCEWLIAIFSSSFVVSFAAEFRKIDVNVIASGRIKDKTSENTALVCF